MATTTPAADTRAPEVLKRCVLVVHGVGEQRKSDTLLYVGSPLVDWVMRWAQRFYDAGNPNTNNRKDRSLNKDESPNDGGLNNPGPHNQSPNDRTSNDPGPKDGRSSS